MCAKVKPIARLKFLHEMLSHVSCVSRLRAEEVRQQDSFNTGHWNFWLSSFPSFSEASWFRYNAEFAY